MAWKAILSSDSCSRTATFFPVFDIIHWLRDLRLRSTASRSQLHYEAVLHLVWMWWGLRRTISIDLIQPIVRVSFRWGLAPCCELRFHVRNSRFISVVPRQCIQRYWWSDSCPESAPIHKDRKVSHEEHMVISIKIDVRTQFLLFATVKVQIIEQESTCSLQQGYSLW